MENLPAERTDQPVIKMAPSGGLLPNNFEGLWRMSSIFAESGLMPKGLQKKEAVFVAIQMGLEVGLSPMQAVQNIAVINGRPSIWGDSVLALVRASGLLESFKEEIIGNLPDDACMARCTAKRKDEAGPAVREFSIADAKRAGLWNKEGPWRQYPKRMLQMRARSWALRDLFSDVLKGMRMAEEVGDYDVDLVRNDLGQFEPGVKVEDTEVTLDKKPTLYGDVKPVEPKPIEEPKPAPIETKDEKIVEKEVDKALGAGMNEDQLYELLYRQLGITAPESMDRCAAYVKHCAEMTKSSIIDALRNAVSNRAQFLAGMAAWGKAQQDAEAKEEPHKGVGNPAYNGPPEGVKMDGTTKEEPPVEEPADLEWDPRTEPLKDRYAAKFAAAVKQVAESMGIVTTNRMPKEVHADILAASVEPPDKDHDQGTIDDESAVSSVRETAKRLSQENETKWGAIIKTMHRANMIGSPSISTMTEVELLAAIDEFEKF